ncbi:MAG: aminodeoxychorismate synthase component I [Bacteroidales bacterium]|jgi:para-aminobenzoate synthetase component 1|nr:aminodeoxychorismate synthase component I [Bacteroidales bacterium]
MKAWNAKEGFQEMNRLGKAKRPFLSIISYDKSKILLSPLEAIDSETCEYAFPALSNSNFTLNNDPIPKLTHSPLSKSDFNKAFEIVMHHIRQGDTYLCNLSFEIPLQNTPNLNTIFHKSFAKYKLRYRDEFVCFSPEIFVRISNREIKTYPMKGTIDAKLPDAESQLLSDPKEKAEHYTITDLLRNDLSRIAEEIKVTKFRYIDKISSAQSSLLQSSSEISGICKSNWKEEIGNIMNRLLPAGSISGAPKKKTLEIINKAETHERGYYTGVCCLFDGESLDSFVLIRMITKQNAKYTYKSGGGITSFSNPEKEYQEILQKIYVPVS